MNDQASHSSPSVQVLVALEVRAIRESVSRFLMGYPELVVVATDVRDLASNQLSPDIALVQWLPTQQELSTRIRHLKLMSTEVKTVVVGVPENPNEIMICIESGAAGYVTECDSLAQMVDTIHMVHRDDAACHTDILAPLFKRMADLTSYSRFLRVGGADQAHQARAPNSPTGSRWTKQQGDRGRPSVGAPNGQEPCPQRVRKTAGSQPSRGWLVRPANAGRPARGR